MRAGEKSAEVKRHSADAGACEMLISMSAADLFPPGVSASLKVPLSGS